MGLPLIAAIAVAAVVLSGGGEGPSAPPPADRGQGSEGGGTESVSLGTPSLGAEDAPVVLTEYSDYQ